MQISDIATGMILKINSDPRGNAKQTDDAVVAKYSQLLRAVGRSLHTVAGLQEIVEIMYVHSRIRRGT